MGAVGLEEVHLFCEVGRARSRLVTSVLEHVACMSLVALVVALETHRSGMVTISDFSRGLW